MKPNETYQISLNGIVQGVGFRPFVYHLAQTFSLNGYVSNGLEGVKIVINSSQPIAEQFLQAIIENLPEKAKIYQTKIKRITEAFFEKFEIRESEKTGNANLILTPDYGVCEACKAEVADKNNRRYGYAFTTCTNCGPRFSIINKLPFDRETTTMQPFKMCEDCQAEYENPTDRRFYSQTNSCAKCGIKLSVYQNGKLLELESSKKAIGLIISNLHSGKIIAIKSIGGFLLICDATNETVVEQLRIRKHRPTKPFAVMIASIESAQKEVVITAVESNHLQSEVAPILLLRQTEQSSICRAVNPPLEKIGLMLPNTPFMQLISEGFGKPMVATSGNISGNPIIFQDEKAIEDFAQIADLIVTNNREIVVPQDDSVVQFSEKYQQKIILRRSRGIALTLPNSSATNLPHAVAFGASLKSTFAIQTPQNLYVSQYLGDLESFETQQNFSNIFNHFQYLIGTSTETQTVFLADAHEGYFSTQLAAQWAENQGVRLKKIQHHKAHFMAVLAENELLFSNENVLGIIWDGTGYGDDKQIWGGEFFYQQNNQIQRLQFSYFDAILGDKMPKEPRISAFSLSQTTDFQIFTKDKFTTTEWNLYQKLIQRNTLQTNSVGRLFDGIASLLGLADFQSYEGEAALLLEQLARQYFRKNGYDFQPKPYVESIHENQVPTKQIVEGVIRDIEAKKDKDFIAARFHFSMIMIVEIVANYLKINKLAFSGGVFQNSLLVDLAIHFLGNQFELFFHKNLSPNDESIAYGQIMSEWSEHFKPY